LINGTIIGMDHNQPKVSIAIIAPDNSTYDAWRVQANSDGSFKSDTIFYGEAGFENKIFRILAKYNNAEAQVNFTHFVADQVSPNPTSSSNQTVLGMGSIGLETIGFTDMEDNAINDLRQGSMILITADLTNNRANLLPFTILIEVRDQNNMTIALQVQTGTLNPSSGGHIGVSWQPEEPGDYSVRAMVFSGLKHPELLSPVVVKTATVEP
jgi:hypothetical protein